MYSAYPPWASLPVAWKSWHRFSYPVPAKSADATGRKDPGHPDPVTRFISMCIRTQPVNLSHDLVSGNHGQRGWRCPSLYFIQFGMADTARRHLSPAGRHHGARVAAMSTKVKGVLFSNILPIFSSIMAFMGIYFPSPGNICLIKL